MRPVLLLAALAVVVSSLALPSAQGANPLIGAWQATEWTTADGSANANVGGMLLFTGRHYSWIAHNGTRPSYPSQAEATDAQRLAAFGTFGANAGTYTVSGSTLTMDPETAKNPYVYAPGQTQVVSFAIEARTLALTSSQGGVRTFSRVE